MTLTIGGKSLTGCTYSEIPIENTRSVPAEAGSDLRDKRTYNPWTSATLLRLRKFYPTMLPAELLVEFAPHSLSSIRSMASQIKIRKQRYRRWEAIAAAYRPVIFAP